jgi:hypothetical protein
MTKATGANMNTVLRMTFSFLIIIGLAGLACASEVSERVDLTKFAGQPEALAGRLIEVSAQVIAINADRKSLELFDSQSRTRISVRLNQLKKADRLALMRANVRRISVSGRASVVAGRLTIDAESVRPVSFNEDAKVQSKADNQSDDAEQTEVVPLAILD